MYRLSIFRQPEKPGATSGQIQGLNHLRFLAALLVFAQHSLSCSHLDDWIDIGGFRLGRIGTAIFFMLSGFLSAVTTRKPLTWLKDRLVFLFPAYWVVTLAGFFLAWITATKTFTVGQFVSQILGTGYLTHGDHIVNVATWFISPLLLLYGAVTLIRLTSVRYMTIGILAAIVVSAITKEPEFATTRCHAVTFLSAFAIGTLGGAKRTLGAIVFFASMAGLSLIQPEFRYASIAALLLIPALFVTTEISLSQSFGRIAYEWFLVHGLCLSIVNHLTNGPIAIIVIGGALAIAAAAVLHRFVQMLRKQVPRAISGSILVFQKIATSVTPHRKTNATGTQSACSQSLTAD